VRARDRAWLISTPFLPGEVNGGNADATRVLFAMDETIDTATMHSKVLSALDMTNETVAVSEADVMLVSAAMRIPLLIITTGSKNDNDSSNLTAVFRDVASTPPML
jgi:hypothetical protein